MKRANILLLSSVGCVGLAGVLGGFSASAGPAPTAQPTALIALEQLQSNFHLANTIGDVELMRSLWAEDAVFSNPALTVTGRDQVTAFFASSPSWGRVANLAPTYRSRYEIHGNTATYRFECVLIDVSGMNPQGTTFSTLPFGGQNPAVQIIQHSLAEGTMVLEGGRWVFQTFRGSAGPG